MKSKKFNKLGEEDSLCWSCGKACDSYAGCRWSSLLEPVPGWDATYNETYDSYEVHDCPLFVKEDLMDLLDSVSSVDALRGAIVQRACEDYLMILTDTVPVGHTYAEYNSREIMKFFRSDYYKFLCNIDYHYLVTKIRKYADKMDRVVWTPVKEGRRWCLAKVKEPEVKHSEVFDTKHEAMYKAADLQGISLRWYLKIRRRDGIS